MAKTRGGHTFKWSAPCLGSSVEFIKRSKSLLWLNVYMNDIGDELQVFLQGAICLARSLKVINEVLISLDLGFNEIRDEGAFSISQALKANEDVRLTSLNLASNFLTKLGLSVISDARDLVFEMNEKELNIFF